MAINDLREKCEQAVFAFEQTNVLLGKVDEGPMEVLVEVANKWLTEHPADEDDPIIEEWLREMGFDHLVPFQEWKIGKIDLRFHAPIRGSDSYWSLNGFILDKAPETRGDVRRLLSSLKIEHK